jgi:Cu(I)/Ag(I) efflux system membrane fusion protein
MATVEPASVRRSFSALLVALLAAASLTACRRDTPEPDASGERPAAQDGPRILYYYDPMRPDVHFDEPGPSPFMDMPLVPKYAETSAPEGIAVSTTLVQTLGVRTAHPVRRTVVPEFRVPARVVADPWKQFRVQSRVDGWVERLHVRAIGERVAAGEPIADIHSPQLVQAQEELLLGGEAGGPAAERLRRLGIAEADIEAVRREGKTARRLPLRAPTDGIVTSLGVVEGSRVSQDTVVADLSARDVRWVEAQLLPAQKLRIGAAPSARFSMPGVAGRHWEGRASQWLPAADAVTQAVVARFRIEGAEDLPLGAVLDAQVRGEARGPALMVPADAVIRTAQGERVVRRTTAGRFAPVPVTAGERYGQEIELLAGLTEADLVVISGAFLLDAEASLQAGLDRMAGEDGARGGAP